MSRPHNIGPEAWEQALALHDESFVLDSHVDTLSEMLDGDYDLSSAPGSAHLSWEKLAQAGCSAQIFACFVSPRYIPDRCAERVDALIDRFEEEVRRFGNHLAPCLTASDIEDAVREGRFAGLLSIEGGHAIQDSLDTLRHFHARGVRAMTLTWNNTNNWADGCGPMDRRLSQHGGLTEFGRRVVGTMEEIGMAVDVSHAAPATFRDVMTMAEKPPLASHSSCKALNDHRRNLTDEQMRELAERDGVLGICFCSGFLVNEGGAWARAKKSEDYDRVTDRSDSVDFAGITDQEVEVYDRRVPLATLEDAVNHVDHALRVMGTGAVGLGSDFDGARRFPVGLEHAGRLPALTARLLERGWRADELRGFLGNNLLDYFRRVVG